MNGSTSNFVHLSSHDDLNIVFDNLEKAVIHQLPSSSSQTAFSQSMKDIFQSVALNCAVNGRPYLEVPTGPVEEFEPVDQGLVDELKSVQTSVDGLITENCKLRHQFLQKLKSMKQELAVVEKSEVALPITSEESKDETIVSSEELTKEEIEEFDQALSTLMSLLMDLPPLVAKSDRYVDFVADEMGSEKYLKHVARLSSETSGAAQSLDFDQLLKQKVDQNFETALQSVNSL